MTKPEGIREVVEGLADAWLEERFDELGALFAEDAVTVTPDLARRLEGRDACVGSFREFASLATLEAFHGDEPTVDVWGATAVAGRRFIVAYEIDGARYREKGAELLVLRRSEDGWHIVWRTVTSAPDRQGPGGDEDPDREWGPEAGEAEGSEVSADTEGSEDPVGEPTGEG